MFSEPEAKNLGWGRVHVGAAFVDRIAGTTQLPRPFSFQGRIRETT
jgi:hypothetical protein